MPHGTRLPGADWPLTTLSIRNVSSGGFIIFAGVGRKRNRPNDQVKESKGKLDHDDDGRARRLGAASNHRERQ